MRDWPFEKLENARSMSLYQSLRRKAADAVYSRLPRYRELHDRASKMDNELVALRSHPEDGWMAPVQHRPFLGLPDLGEKVIEPSLVAPDGLVARIQSAYRNAHQTKIGPSDSMWLGHIAEAKKDVHGALITKNSSEIARMLEHPLEHNLFEGFDGFSRNSVMDGELLRWHSLFIFDNLLRLAEAIGVRRTENPENPPKGSRPSVEELLSQLDDAVGFKITFPNPFRGESGLPTSRGIMSHRAVQALFQSWRIFKLAGKSGRVAEVGAGTGRNAFYARQFGLKDYTIVDLPMTSVAQAFFLGCAVGPADVSLYGEPRRDDAIKIMPPEEFMSGNSRYDVVANVDSLTEMSRETATSYCEAFAARARIFLSINHESNPFTVREISNFGHLSVSRESHWMRRGYVEEVFRY